MADWAATDTSSNSYIKNKPVSIVGATGAAGVTGAVGQTGAVGSTGAAGTTGIAGVTGAVGPTGAVGNTGATGALGPTGIAGVTGAVGPTGVAGTTGIAGVTGAVGPTGASPMTVTPGQTLTFPPCVLPGPGTQTGSGDANTTFTIAVSGQAYGNGTYITTASSNYFNIYESWKAFGSLSSAYWTSDYLYSVVTGAYAGSMATTIDGTAYIGEWIRITMPTAIWATSISMTGGGGSFPITPSRL